MTPQELLTLGIVALAAVVVVVGLALLFAREPEPEPEPDHVYRRTGAARYSRLLRRRRK